MSNNLEDYTGTTESPFKVTAVIAEAQVFYKVESKTDIEPPSISLGLGDAINLAKDLIPKLAAPQYSLFLTSVSFTEKLYNLTQKSYEKLKLNPDLDMELEHEANVLNALVSSVVDTYGGGKTGKKILDSMFKDHPLYESITGKIKGSIGDAIGEVVSDKYKEYMNEGKIDTHKDEINASTENTIEDLGDGKYKSIDENGNETTIDTQNGTSKTTLDDGTVIENTPTQTTVTNTDGTKDTISLENGNLTKTTYDENNNQISSVSLSEGQTISHIAQNIDNINSIDLLEYNNLTLEQAKSLPVGFEVQIPKDITEIQTPEGTIKLYESYDETGVILQPDGTRIQYDENSNILIYGDNDKITFTDTNDTYQEWLKDTDGNIYKSLESNNDFTITYDNTKTVTNIEIHSDNVSLDEIANLTSYSKEDLQTFNFLEGDTINADTNFSLPTSKETIQGGYDDITHFTTNDGNDMFVVPQEDGSSITYATFTDGFENQAYYERNSNGSMDITLSNPDGNLLLHTLFVPISALSQKKYSSLSLLSSNILFSQSLELEKNRVSNNRFYGMREVA